MCVGGHFYNLIEQKSSQNLSTMVGGGSVWSDVGSADKCKSTFCMALQVHV